MAKALQCPDCGQRHPLDEVAGVRTFRCASCHRLLKVPKGVAEAASGNGAGTRHARETTKTTARPAKVPPSQRDAASSPRVPPTQRGDAYAHQRDLARQRDAAAESTAALPAARPRVPRAIRVVVWLIALPVGLLPVLFVGRATGILSIDAAIDVFVGSGWGRYLPPLVVLPVWAALSASIAHFTIETVGRMLTRR